MNPTIAMPVTPEFADTAEKLCDLIYKLNGGSLNALIVDYMMSEESMSKFMVSARLAFSSVDVVSNYSKAKTRNPSNMVFAAAAQRAAQAYKSPWLWLEPGTVPVDPRWVEKLAALYESSPMRYLGLHMKSGQMRFMHRVGIYPPDAMTDLEARLNTDDYFELDPAESVVRRCASTKMIQGGIFEKPEDLEKLRSDAVLVCGDKSNIILQRTLESAKPPGRRIPVTERIRSKTNSTKPEET